MSEFKNIIHRLLTSSDYEEINEVQCDLNKIREIYEKLQAENSDLRRKLDLAVGALEYYAEGLLGNDLEVKPEKRELWNIPEKWACRSMSDHYAGKRARQALAQIRGEG